jgi:hypothetical protein
MTLNMGGLDRVVRVVVGVGFVSWALLGGPVWAWIGVLPLVTAAIGYCPAYVPFGFSTRARPK